MEIAVNVNEIAKVILLALLFTCFGGGIRWKGRVLLFITYVALMLVYISADQLAHLIIASPPILIEGTDL